MNRSLHRSAFSFPKKLFKDNYFDGSSNECISTVCLVTKLITAAKNRDSLAGGHTAGVACYSSSRNSRVFRGHTEACPVARARQHKLMLRPKSQACRQSLCQSSPDRLPSACPCSPMPTARGPLPPPAPRSLRDLTQTARRRPQLGLPSSLCCPHPKTATSPPLEASPPVGAPERLSPALSPHTAPIPAVSDPADP